MDTVRFTIQRKAAFSGAFLLYRMSINGQDVGKVRNGKEITADVPRAAVYR